MTSEVTRILDSISAEDYSGSNSYPNSYETLYDSQPLSIIENTDFSPESDYMNTYCTLIHGVDLLYGNTSTTLEDLKSDLSSIIREFGLDYSQILPSQLSQEELQIAISKVQYLKQEIDTCLSQFNNEMIQLTNEINEKNSWKDVEHEEENPKNNTTVLTNHECLEDYSNLPLPTFSPTLSSDPSLCSPKPIEKKKVTKSKQRQTSKRKPLDYNQKCILYRWSYDHIDYLYPTIEEKMQFVKQTGLRYDQVNNWFVNTRKRIYKSQKDIDNFKSFLNQFLTNLASDD